MSIEERPRIVNVKVLARDDQGPAVPDIGPDTPDAVLTDVVILEQGMTSGRTSVALVFRAEDGKPLGLCQLSAAQFDQIAGAVQGAALRFGEVLR